MLVAGAVALTFAAALMASSTFMLYDDEGYVLTSLRNFTEHGRLYGEVYSQYGPFPYVLYYALHLLGLPLTHGTGRLITLLAWSGCATASAWLVWKATRHSACMLATLASVFVYLWVMISEPSHPGGLVAFVTAIMGVAGYLFLAAGRWTAWGVLAGVGCAVLLLTKINVGVFATLSAVTLLCSYSPHERVRRWTPAVVALGLAMLPFLLMRPLLGTGWVQAYALIFAFAAGPIALTLARGAAGRDGGRPWRAALLAGFGTAAVILGIVFLRGTTPAQLLGGVLLGPLRHPGHFSLVLHWPPGVVALASVSFALFLLVLASLRLGWFTRLTIDTLVVALRLALGVGLVIVFWRFPDFSPDHLVFGFSLTSLWMFLWPLTGEDPAAVRARSWLALLFVGQWLHAFPVPGSQIAWGTFLAVPLGVMGVWQGAVWLTEQHGRVFHFQRAQKIDLSLTMALTAMAVLTGNQLAKIGARYFDSRPLNLPGAENLRLPDQTTALYRLLTVNATVHSDLLFSLPGMFSFNLWSGLPTPTLVNVTHWFSLLDEPQQQAIIAALARHPRAVVIVQAEHLKFLRERNLTAGGPLYDYVMNEFKSAFELDGFEFRVRRGRRVVPFFTAEMFHQAPAAAGAGTGLDSMAKIPLLLPSDRAVGRVEIIEADQPKSAPFTLNAASARVEITPIELDGRPRGPARAATFPFQLNGPCEVALYFNRGAQPFPRNPTLLVLRDPAGVELALVRWRP